MTYPKRVVIPLNLGGDFDIGVQTPNKINVRFGTTSYYGKVRFATKEEIATGDPSVVVSAADLKTVADRYSGVDWSQSISQLQEQFNTLHSTMTNIQSIAVNYSRPIEVSIDENGLWARVSESLDGVIVSRTARLEGLITEERQLRIGADSAEARTRELVRADLQTQIDGQGGAITSVRAYVDEVKGVLVDADSAEASARELVRADLQTQIDGHGGAITSVRAYVDEVKAVLVTADSAEALARQTVRSDLEGMVNAATGLIEDLSAHVESVRQTLVGSDTSIAQAVVTLEATVTQNNRSSAFDAAVAWTFDVNTENWTVTGATSAVALGLLTVTSNSTAPNLSSPTITETVNGVEGRYVRALVRRKAGSGWTGAVYYKTAGHDFSESYKKVMVWPTVVNEWTIVEWDMHSLTAGGNDWRDSNILQIRLHLGASVSDVFEIDWIMIGRYGAGGNYLAAQVDSKYSDITTTLSTNLGSEVNTRTTLSSDFTKQVGNLRTFTVRAKGSAAVSTTAGLYADNDTSSMNTMAASYNVWVINRADSSVASFTTYNVAANAANATAMAAALNALDNTKIVVIATYGDAKANRLSNGLDAAIYRCGGTQVVYGNTTYFKTGSAYILVGVPGDGEGSGAERYAGVVDADTNALISFTFSVRGGNIIGVAGAGLISSQIIKTAADIVTESYTRADAISAEATTRDALLATVTSTIGARKIFNQVDQPAYDTLFPPNVNACPAAALEPIVLTNGAISFTGKAGWTAGCDLDVAHTLPGGHTLYVRHASSVSSAEFMSMMQFGGPTPWISAGNAYEFSAYVGATQCSQAFLRMTFYDINDAVINYISSYVNTNGGEWSSGLGINGKVTTADYPANGDLSTYKRLWVHGVAPVNATSLKCQITAYGNNATGFALYATRPFFGKMASGQTTPANWQSYDPPAWYDTDDGNKYYLWSGINGAGWVETTDTRTTNAASVTYVNQAVATETSARGTSESNILATVNDNQTKAAFDAAVTYAFDSAEWTATGATVAASYGVFTVTSSSTSPIIISPALSVNGATNRYIRAKVRRTAGAGWKGNAGYTTVGHGFSASYYATTAFTAPLNTWVILEWDMHALVAGGTDWRDNTVTQIRLELGASASDVFEIDWIAVGRYGPGGVSASASVRSYAEGVADLLSSETQARTDLSSAFTSQIGNYKSYSIKTKGNAASATGLGLYINDVAAPQSLATGYNVWVIARDTGSIVSFNTYNLNADAANATAMASALNALTNSSFVIIAAYNYSKTNRLVNGLDTAMYRCGASKAIYGADVSAFGAASPFKSNAAYILVGVPGDGEGSGVERYKGDADNDVNAIASYSTALRNGQIVGLSGVGLLSAAISQTNADISNVNSTLTTADAAQATTSSLVSARMVFEGGGFVINPAFANWPDGVTYPVGYSTWSTNSIGNGNAVNRVTGKKSPYALELVNAAGYQQGIFFGNPNGANPNWIGSFGDRYLVMRIEFELVSGDLTNGGWLFHTYNAFTLLTEVKELFSTTAPTPVAGRVYVVEKVVDLGAASATANGCCFWLFTSYAGFNGTYNAKTIRIHGCQMRAATNEEINTFTAGGPISTAISAAVQTETTARVTADTALSNSLTALTTRVGAAESGLTTEQTTRSTADTALSNSLSVVSAKLYYDVAGCFNNSNFGNWPDGATFPAGLSDGVSLGSGRAINRVVGRRSPWALEMVAPDAMDMGVSIYSKPSNSNANWVGPSGLRYYTLTIEVELIAGDFQRAGWYIAGYNGDTSIPLCSSMYLFTADIPAPVVGKTYTISRVIDLCADGATEAAAKTATGYHMHIFANWAWFAGSYSAKTLRIHQWHIRPATSEEIRTFNVAGEISAAVQTETTARVTADTAISNSLTAL
jgi:hypothetical protein